MIKRQIKISEDSSLKNFVDWAKDNKINLKNAKVKWLWTENWGSPEPFFVEDK